MQNAAGDAHERVPHDQNDGYDAVVADLARLIEQVQGSLRLMEQEMAGEAMVSGVENAGNVVVLDDISPRYMTATAALHACEANLNIALHSLRHSGDGYPVSPALSIVGA